MKILLITAISLLFSVAYADQDIFKTKVAVIDTGFSGLYATPKTSAALCKNGHYDFTTNTPNVGYDVIGHGTFVSNLIIENANKKGVCLLIYKVGAYVAESTRDDIGKALTYAYKRGARIVNISMGHPHFSHKEKKAVNIVTRRGMKIFASAGNDGANLNKKCTTFPACYRNNKNLYRVGSLDQSGLLETYSNRGSIVHIYEFGSIPGVGRGTSFAAPRAVARYLREIKSGKR